MLPLLVIGYIIAAPLLSRAYKAKYDVMGYHDIGSVLRSRSSRRGRRTRGGRGGRGGLSGRGSRRGLRPHKIQNHIIPAAQLLEGINDGDLTATRGYRALLVAAQQGSRDALEKLSAIKLIIGGMP